jgi:hypothetical protein
MFSMPTLDSTRLLGLFLIYPSPGYLKTRMAIEFGDDMAAKLYGEMAEKVIERFSQWTENRMTFHLYCHPIEPLDRYRNWLQRDSHYLPQVDGDLGTRLDHAFHGGFSQGAERVVLLGSDDLEVDPELIDYAFSRMDETDIVLGPEDHGTFYLVGARSFEGVLFGGLSLGQESMEEEIEARVSALGLSMERLPDRS